MPASKIAVCVATTGRPAVLTETLRDVLAQTRRPDRVLVCPVKPEDVEADRVAALGFDIETIVGAAPGLPAQRNALLRACGAVDIVLFIDDDFLLAPTYVERLVALFEAHPDCVIATGRVLADGATGPGYSVAEGRAIIGADASLDERVTPTFNAYGCNMAIRWSAIRPTGCSFDEQLPLYAWAEDVDFSRQAAAYGTVLRYEAMTGVHLASKSGRVSGVRFGYSQIANQIYLARKGSVTMTGGLRKAIENIAANALGAIRNRGWIDRRGRLLGNLYGLRDALVGRSHPQRILDL